VAGAGFLGNQAREGADARVVGERAVGPGLGGMTRPNPDLGRAVPNGNAKLRRGRKSTS